MTAVDPLVTGASVRVDVPRASLAHFATLDRALRAALDLADAGIFLTPPTQPELQALRVWLCGEVLGQSHGAEPVAWSSLDEPPLGHPHLLRWDGAHVSGSVSFSGTSRRSNPCSYGCPGTPRNRSANVSA